MTDGGIPLAPWTELAVGRLAAAGVAADAGAVAELTAVIFRGEQNFARSGRGEIAKQHVDDFADRMLQLARAQSVDHLDAQTVRQMMGRFCPGFFPWC